MREDSFMKKRIILAAGLPLALLGLSACSTYDSYGYGYGGGGYASGSYGYGGSGYYNEPYYGGGGGLSYYDGWYDNYYGPVSGGYWAPDGYFWYQSRLNGPFVRDHYRHFRRDYWGGANHFRFPNRGDGDRDRDRDWDRNTPRLFEGQLRDRNGDRDNNWNGRGDNDRDRNRDNNWNGRGGIDRGNNNRWSDRNAPRSAPPPPHTNQASPPPRQRDDGPPRANNNNNNNNRDRGGNRGDGGGNRSGDRSGAGQGGGGERGTPSLWKNRPN